MVWVEHEIAPSLLSALDWELHCHLSALPGLKNLSYFAGHDFTCLLYELCYAIAAAVMMLCFPAAIWMLFRHAVPTYSATSQQPSSPTRRGKACSRIWCESSNMYVLLGHLKPGSNWKAGYLSSMTGLMKCRQLGFTCRCALHYWASVLFVFCNVVVLLLFFLFVYCRSLTLIVILLLSLWSVCMCTSILTRLSRNSWNVRRYGDSLYFRNKWLSSCLVSRRYFVLLFDISSLMACCVCNCHPFTWLCRVGQYRSEILI